MSEEGCTNEASAGPGCDWLAVGRKRECGGENQRCKPKGLVFSPWMYWRLRQEGCRRLCLISDLWSVYVYSLHLSLCLSFFMCKTRITVLALSSHRNAQGGSHEITGVKVL